MLPYLCCMWCKSPDIVSEWTSMQQPQSPFPSSLYLFFSSPVGGCPGCSSRLLDLGLMKITPWVQFASHSEYSPHWSKLPLPFWLCSLNPRPLAWLSGSLWGDMLKLYNRKPPGFLKHSTASSSFPQIFFLIFLQLDLWPHHLLIS